MTSFFAAELAGVVSSHLLNWLIVDHLNAVSPVPVLDQFAGGKMPLRSLWPRWRSIQRKVRVLIDALLRAVQQHGAVLQP